MNHKKHLPGNFLKRGLQLCASLLFALVFLFIPLTAGSRIHIPFPSHSALVSRGTAVPGPSLDFFLPFGAEPVRATNGLTITKSAASFVDQGGVLTYTLNITNETGQVITRSLITDAVPAGTTCLGVQSPPAPPLWGDNNSTCASEAAWLLVYDPNITVLSTPFSDGTRAIFTYSVAIAQPLPDGHLIVNNAYRVEGSNSTSTFTDDGLPLTTTVRAPAWAITKTVSSNTVEPGDYLTYTITLSNTGSQATQGSYTVTDVLPANTNPASLIIGPPSGSLNGDTVTWVLSDPIAAGASRTLIYAVRANTPLTDGVTIVNQDYGVTGGNVFTPATGTPVTATVTSSATLVITKTASANPVGAGNLLTYTLTVSHHPTSKGPAFGLVISDTLPGEVIYQSAGFIAPATGIVTDTGAPTILWGVADPLPVGSSAQVTVTVRVTSPLKPGVMTNTFGVSAANAPPVSGTLVTAITSTNIITLSKEVAPATVAPGDPVTYTVTLTNSGNGIAVITLTDLLPQGFIPTTYTQPVFTLPGRSLFTTASTTTVSFTATTPLTPGIYLNRVITATYDTTQTTLSNVAPVHVVNAVINLEKVATPQIVEVGDTITYTYLLTNSGDITLTNLTLVDDPLGPVTLGTTTLAPSATTSGTLTRLVGLADLPGPIVNTATVTGTYLSNNLVTTSTTATVYHLNLTLDKSASQLTAAPGDRITYTYRITNTGSLTLTNVTLFDDEPGIIIPLGSTTLGPNQSTTGTFVRNVNQGDLPGPITNTATVTGTDSLTGQETTVATDTATVSLTYTVGISLAKTVDVSTATIDQVIAYTYRLTNSGQVNLSNVTLFDDRLGVITSGITLMAGLPSTTVITTYRIVSADFPGPLTNTATVTGTAFDSTVVTDTAQAAVTLVFTPGIQLRKVANVATALPGQIITYTYTVTNTGNVTLTGVVLSDDRIPGVTVSPTTIPPNGGTATGTATYTVLAGDIPAITNTAVVTGNDILNNPITDTATATVNVVAVLTAITPTNSSPTLVNSTTFFTVTTNLSSGVTFTWNFADGSPVTAPTVSTTTNHIYTAVGIYTVVVTATNGPSTITGTTVVTITSGPLDRFLLTATTPQTAGNPFPLTITAVDQFDNTVTSFNGPVNLNDTTGGMIPTLVTLVNGVTTTNVTVFSATSPALDTITAITGSISGTVQVEIRPNVPTTLTLTVAPTSIQVCQTLNVTASLTDNWNNPVPGRPITLTQTFPGTFLLPRTGTTNSAGIFTSTLRGDGAGSGDILGLSGSLFGLFSGITVNNPAVPSVITVTVSPAAVPFNTSAVATAQVRDCVGNPVNGAVVTFTIGALGVITPPTTATTNAGGVATITVASGATAGVTTITGTVAGPLSDNTPFTILPPATPVLAISKTAIPAGSTVQSGSLLTYSLVISNSGTGPATNVVITDTLGASVTFAGGSITSGAGPTNNGGVVTFTIPSLAQATRVTATLQVTVTAATSGTILSNSATASSNQTGAISPSNVVTHRVVTTTVAPVGPLYLPIIQRGFQELSDLTITDFFITPANPTSGDTVVVTVVVQNQGNASTAEGFWTDFYVNPQTLPNNPSLGRDRRWNNPAINSSHGLAWSLPALAAGESLTLTSDGVGGLGPVPGQSRWTGQLPGGNYSLYTFVDSFDIDDATGPTNVEVVELNEANNLDGPIGVVIAAGLEVNEAGSPAELPARQDLGR